jgi:predicted hydrocarbon binding protein
VDADPLEIRAVGALTARVGEYGGACRLYTGLTAGLLEMSGLDGATVAHPECERRGDPRCVWRVESGAFR